MDGNVVVAGLSLVGTLAGTFGGILTANRLTGYRIEKLEEQVSKHNNMVERIYRLEDNDKMINERLDSIIKREDKNSSVIDRTHTLEKLVGVLENRTKVSEHRLDDLEAAMKH